MKFSGECPDLSQAFVTTAVTQDVIPTVDAYRLAQIVYGEFSGGAPIHDHIIGLAATLRPGVNGTISNDLDTLKELQQFEYLNRGALTRQALRMKGIIAINMVYPEICQDELSAQLVEPFKGVVVLPGLYSTWKNIPRIN